ncbi:hypothetical protein ACJ72_07695, partial [Emergomyces africanus]
MADRIPPERLFCYQCQSVWARNDREGPLQCPICASEFVEIVESNGPPPDLLPPREESSPSTGRQHHPPSSPFHNLDGPGETHTEQFETPGGGTTYRSFRSGDGRFTIASTSFRSTRASAPQDQQHPHDIPGNDPFVLLRNTTALLQALADHGRAGRMRTAGSPGPRSRFPMMHEPHDDHDPDDFGINIDGDGNMFRLRWRLAPRDAYHGREDTATFAHLEELLGRPLSPGQPHWNQVDGGVNGDVADIRSIMTTLLQNLAFGAGRPDENPDRPITQEQLALLKTRTLKETLQETEGSLDRVDGTETCGICIETVDLDSRVTMLPCKHWFHATCITPWLDDHNTCPHCRARIASPTSPTPNEGQQRTSGSGSRSTPNPPGRG